MTLYLHGTCRQNELGHLEIGGVDAVSLAETYGTPLYVYDVALIRERAKKLSKSVYRRRINGAGSICE
ncbi:hypothetical protein BsIDN1_40650 [Bacillus safensis]|uniref:Orn/DAP/Arg decarboxylase 2 N-terminal domain-containing protein n=1 Tax=Bacillus safensis TaxID=561879 RepID=A0A5S9MAC9_BACIA|nr:hypothetical protein BsIDN1_40650 [Bacillus safensis]